MAEYDHELPFEKDLVDLLVREKGWKDDVFINPTEEELIQNWANIIYDNNKQRDRLDRYPLTQGEIKQLIDQINAAATPMMKNELITYGEMTITRDNPDHKERFGKQVTLYIFDRNAIAKDKSRYQIVRQPQFPTLDPMLRNRRGDVMLLINGLPVIHVELKSSKVGVGQAIEELQLYCDRGIFRQGLFSLVQFFVVMNPEDMRYFANPGFGVKFNKDFQFKWADANNIPQTHWKYIAETFLSIPMAHQLIGYYTVADKGDNNLKVLRSYQYYAADRIAAKVEMVNKMHWEGNDIYGGFIEHTTGSGKTLTSFKAAQLIAKRKLADKVIFLVDRIELGTQSKDEYTNFADAQIEVQDTNDTKALVGKLKSDDEENILIVTSIQKLSRIGQDSTKKADLNKINTKHIVVIVDECHRSTFGEMLARIKKTLAHAIYFGFSGTPIRDENGKNGMVTADIFGSLLHRYSIADGIRDKNVLGFDPYMIETYSEFDIRQQVAFDKANVTSEEEAFADEKKKVYLKYMNDVPMAGYWKDDGRYAKGIEDYLSISQYDNERHRKAVVKDIKQKWMHRSIGNKYHAILATSGIAEAVDYYRLFKEEMPQLRVSCLFDPTTLDGEDNEDGNGRKLSAAEKEEALKEIILDYDNRYGKKYNVAQHAKFKKDLSLRLAHKKPYLNLEPGLQLDLLIVVWQMLTGYDSKWLNTLYLDKVLEKEHLIQAFSRTNRLNGLDKQHGTICYYRMPHSMKRNVDIAFKLYSGDKPFDLFVLKLPENLRKMNEAFLEIKDLFESDGIENFERLPNGQPDKAKFAQLFHDFTQYLYASRLQGFSWDNLTQRLPNGVVIEVVCDEETYHVLLQRYKELSTGGGGGGGTDDVPYDIDTQISELATGKINTDYMNSNFTKYVKSLQGNQPTEEQQRLLNNLHKSFASLSQEEQDYARLFLSDFQNGDIQLEEGKSFYDYIVEYQTRAKDSRIQRFADTIGIDATLLREAMKNVFSESDITNALLKPIKDSLDKAKAKNYLEKLEGESMPMRKVMVKTDELLRQFILQGGFEIQVPSSYEEMEFEPAMAAEGFEYYKLTPTNHSIIDIFGGDNTVLVGCYKTKKHFEWIKTNNLYNVRLGARKGSLENEQALLDRTTILVLYNIDKPSNASVYKINGHQEMTGKELIEIGYPNPNAGKRYMTFKLSSSSIDSEMLAEENLIERLIGNLPNHINGAPVIIER